MQLQFAVKTVKYHFVFYETTQSETTGTTYVTNTDMAVT